MVFLRGVWSCATERCLGIIFQGPGESSDTLAKKRARVKAQLKVAKLELELLEVERQAEAQQARPSAPALLALHAAPPTAEQREVGPS